ncbi:YggS family pyridoxal phosphate-dependent enzyme [Deefgea salmonis]|uniref:Pyridoxal phosphate homeostasis protein n=1 Tax=Deefgea salmonis TaxID=2875502 RepID=A0ABS8BIG1_9NEIS|nr:YggS family pyridoxal phosphate-dependent enzyme [Deefgea salmonis]MCB5195473.1 YggS family pyridoxal phosphate-dependent enzyme [Deefgea salmonis]
MATIFTALQDVQARIDTACTAVGRNPAAVKLLAVSKTFPAADIQALYQFGQRAFGENYAQELANKCQILAEYNDIEWHFIGPLQSNKTRLVAENAAWVHTIERFKIAERLSAQRPTHLPPINICLQVNVSGETTKSGVAPEQVLALAEQVAKLPQLCLRGLMCIPESSHDSEILAQQFLVLVQLKAQLQARGYALDTLSMGMSNDLESAIAADSTLVRVGSAIFGQRHYSS